MPPAGPPSDCDVHPRGRRVPGPVRQRPVPHRQLAVLRGCRPRAVRPAGRRPPGRPPDREVPPHGTLCRVRRSVGLLRRGRRPEPVTPEPVDTAGAPTPAPAQPADGQRPAAGHPETQPSGPGGAAAAADHADAVRPPGNVDSAAGSTPTDGTPTDSRTRARRPTVTVTDAPKIVTRHIGNPESWTLKGYLASDGYQGLRKALTMTRQQIHDEVNTANILGRGGAGFEAGRKWGMLRKAEPVYLVDQRRRERTGHLQGPRPDRAGPASDHRGHPDHAPTPCGASQVFIYIRGEFALGLERITAALNEAYAYGAVGRNVFGVGLVRRRGHPSRGRGLHLRRRDRPAREPRRQARAFPASSRRSSRPPSASTRRPPSSTTWRRCPTSPGS